MNVASPTSAADFGRPAPAALAQVSPSNARPAAISALGALCIALGAAGLVVIAARGLTGHDTGGSLPASSLVLMAMGFALHFPTMLQDGTLGADGSSNVSTMRVAVFLVVNVFALVTVNVGWATASLADLKIDPSWAWILAAAFGGKAAQSLAENSAK